MILAYILLVWSVTQLLLLILKDAKIINWNWKWICTPSWLIITFALLVGIFILCELFTSWSLFKIFELII